MIKTSQMKGNKKTKKGFTLIELLVVIAIIAILSVVVILTLNPAELLRQSRDSNRISDLSVTKSAISFYLASVNSPNLASSSAGYNEAYYSQANPPVLTTASSGFSTADITAANVTGSVQYAINSTGWIPVNFTAITAGGSPLASLPHDPVNSTTSLDSYGDPLIYGYAASSSLLFKLTAHMESQKYQGGTNPGSNDVETTDGGNSNYTYEQGTLLTL
jgi:prepilin-type N-terminal cleavage/methylation domain-containing protein